MGFSPGSAGRLRLRGRVCGSGGDGVPATVEQRVDADKGAANVESAGASSPVLATFDQVIPDDLIVQGSACVGLDCVNNESFSKPYSREIFGRRRVVDLLDYAEYESEHPIVVEETCGVEDVARIIIDAGDAPTA